MGKNPTLNGHISAPAHLCSARQVFLESSGQDLSAQYSQTRVNGRELVEIHQKQKRGQRVKTSVDFSEFLEVFSTFWPNSNVKHMELNRYMISRVILATILGFKFKITPKTRQN